MHWIERIFGRKENVSTEIKFDELEEWLESYYIKVSGIAGKEARSVYSDIEDNLVEITKSTDMLESSKPEGRYHLKMVKIATSNRDNMVKQVRMLVENITIPGSTDIRTITGFHENAMQTLTVCLENMMKSHQYAKMVFLEDSKNVIADVNSLGKLLNRLIEPINKNKKVFDALEKARNAMEAIKNRSSEIELEKKRIEDLDKSILGIKDEIENVKNALMKLEESHEWKQYLNSKQELDNLENKAKNTESEIERLILPLNKAFNRLKQLSESGRYTLAPEIRESLYSCMTDPKCVDPEFLNEFEKIVGTDALNLSSDKRDKMLEQIKTSASSLGSKKERYKSLVKEIEERKIEISRSDIPAQAKYYGDRLLEYREKLALVEKEKGISQKHVELLTHTNELTKQELQKVVHNIDIRTEVLF